MIVLDRFEGDFAVLETVAGIITVPRLSVCNAKEGDVLILSEDGVYYPDPQATELRRASIRSKFDRLKKKKS